MTGKAFLDRLEGAFPGLLAAFYSGDYRISRERDAHVAGLLQPLTVRLDVALTPDIVAKARLRHGVAAFRQPRLQRKCAAIEHAPLLGDACLCGEVAPPREPAPSPQALGPQGRFLFEEREPAEGPAIPEQKGLDLSEESAAKVARHLLRLMQQNAGTSAEVGSNGAGVGVAS